VYITFLIHLDYGRGREKRNEERCKWETERSQRRLMEGENKKVGGQKEECNSLVDL